jgi:hypothetical protein
MRTVNSGRMGERLSNEQHRADWLATCEAAGIEGLQFRDLRRTFARYTFSTNASVTVEGTNVIGPSTRSARSGHSTRSG